MSAPLLDSGHSLQNLDPKGQFSAPLQFDFSGFFSNNQSHNMNSSNANNGRPGFGGSNEMNSGLGFNSSGLGSGKTAFGTASGLSKPRLVKLRRHTLSQHPRPTPASETPNVDPGFNPFRPVYDNSRPVSSGSEMGSSVPGSFIFGKVDDGGAFVFGSSLSDSSLNLNSGIGSSGGNTIADDMTKLKIDGGKDFMSTKNAVNNVNVSDRDCLSGADETGASKLLDEMGKMKIGGPKNVESTKNAKVVSDQTNLSFGSDKNIASGKNVAAQLLPNELNLKKLNIKDPGEVDGGRVMYNADDMEKFPFASSATTLHNKMNSLNIKDSVGENKGARFGSSEKGSFAFGSGKTVTGNLGGRTENMIIDEIGNLNIGSRTDQKPGQVKTGLSSSGFSVNEMRHKNEDNKKFNDVSDTIPKEFTFDHQHDDTKLHSTFEPVKNVSTVPSTEGPEKKDGFSFTSKRDEVGTPNIEFKTPNPRGNQYSGLNQKLEFSAKWESGKDTRSKKKRGKLRKPIPNPLRFGQNYVSWESNLQENVESSEAYSPMDVSPYQEILADDKYSRETSVTSDGSFNFDDNFVSDDTLPTVSHDPTDEDLVNATQCLDINEGDKKYPESKGEDSESFKSAAEQLDNISDMSVNSVETGESFSSKIERQDSDGRTQFYFASSSEDTEATNFTFAASSSSQSQFSSSTRHQKKKNWIKVGQDSYNATPNAKVPFAASSVQFFPLSGNSSVLYPRQGQKEDPPDPSTSLSKLGNMSEVVRKQEIKPETTSVPAASISAQEACEKWRLRGNQAYANGDLSKAEDYYTQGVNCVSQSETSRSCLRALMLCYSNRAATRMSLGRMREALGDCMMAASIDPNFVRVQVRAANCYLVLGEVENALLHFKKCLQSGSDVCADRKLLVEASEGIQKAQKVSECISQSVNLLQQRKSSDLESALEIIAEALIISSNSEKLQEMKAGVLFSLRKYDEVIQMCELALRSAEMNTPLSGVQSHLAHLDGSELWPWRLVIKSYFYLGRLEEALDFIKKQEEAGCFVEKSGSKSLETVIPLAGTVHELLRLKAAGNEAFQSGRNAEAVEHYTAALSCNVESRPFAAICFCNRAAAYRALGQITDAIADCSLAIALDGNYFKAISRRATLYEMIRDYGQAAIDLQRLVTLLVKQVEEKGNHSGSSDRTSWVNELKQAQLRLSIVEEEDKKEIPLNMYLILGIEPSVSASEIKKAYRKAALKYHPDKAGQSLARNENGDDGLWKEVAEEVHKDADRLFKMIGEAYAVLSDPTKRSRYDLEEEVRNAQKRGSGNSTSRTHTDVHNYPFERSSSRRQWQEWRPYGNSQSRGSEKTRSNRYS